MGDGAVGCEDPAVFVGAEAGWVVDVHLLGWKLGWVSVVLFLDSLSNEGVFYLDEVLVKAVITAVPAARSVYEFASVNVNVSSDKTRPWLGGSWLGAQKVAFGFLCEGTVGLVSGQVGQASPFHHQGSGSSETVGG